jgi:flagellar basal body-associated protein FliL
MNILISMPGGMEWILVIVVLALFIAAPVAILIYAIRTSSKNKALKTENAWLQKEVERLGR